jgi:predicted ATPase
LAQLQRGLHGWLATDSVTYHTYYLGLLADVLRRQNRTDKARRILREALALVIQTGESLYEPELYRLRGEVRLHSATPSANETAKALEDFRTALMLGRDQQARSYALAAAMNLVNYEKRFGVAVDARRELEAEYGWFKEGFETPNLREAKKLLGA